MSYFQMGSRDEKGWEPLPYINGTYIGVARGGQGALAFPKFLE